MKRLLSSTVLVLIAYAAYSLVPPPTFPIVWTNGVNITVNADNSLTKTGVVNTWDSGITSQNALMPGSDGYLQFTYTGVATDAYMVSLSRLNNDPSYALSDYSIFVYNGLLYVYNTTTLSGTFGALAVNDVLKVSREGNAINFYKNGTVFKTIALTANTDNLRADVTIYKGSAPVIVSSFKPSLLLKPQFTFPSLSNNDGGIALQVESQYNPLTYSWSSGEAVASITGKPRSTTSSYTATVTDAQSGTVTRSYGLGYPIAWTNLASVLINADNTLTKTDAVGWTAGASSLNVLPANTDGWIEFVINEPSSSYMIGFSRIDKDSRYVLIDYKWYIEANGNIGIYDAGATLASIGSILKGDVFRIAREGGNIKYYLNGVVKRTVATPAGMTFVADLSINNNYGPLPIISASFDKQIRVLPSLTLPTTSNAGGSIALSVQGVYPPSTLSWSSGETSNIITNKSRNKYTITITDAASHTFTRSYQLGYPVAWNDLQNVGLTGNNTIYAKPTTTYGCSAVSSNVLLPANDGWMEFTLPAPSSQLVVGLATTNSAPYYTSINYAFSFNNGVDVGIYELGVFRGNVGNQSEGDVFTIAREGSNIKYYINGVVVRTVAATPTLQLFVDTSLTNGSLPLVTTSFSRIPQTYYSRANGVWTDPTVWSLTEGGTAATQYPGNDDTAVVKGYKITINSGIYSSGVNVMANSDATSLVVDGATTSLTVKGNVVLRGDNNTATAKALVLQNSAVISVQP